MNQFTRFLAAGGVAALANWGSRFAFERFLPLTISIVFAYGVGMLVAYVLNRHYVFGSSKPMLFESARFLLVNIVSILVVVMVTLALTDWVFPTMGFSWHPTAVAHAIGVASPVLMSYAAHRYYTFSGSGNSSGNNPESNSGPRPTGP